VIIVSETQSRVFLMKMSALGCAVKILMDLDDAYDG
jgi:hypothetical protein